MLSSVTLQYVWMHLQPTHLLFEHPAKPALKWFQLLSNGCACKSWMPPIRHPSKVREDVIIWLFEAIHLSGQLSRKVCLIQFNNLLRLNDFTRKSPLSQDEIPLSQWSNYAPVFSGNFMEHIIECWNNKFCLLFFGLEIINCLLEMMLLFLHKQHFQSVLSELKDVGSREL